MLKAGIIEVYREDARRGLMGFRCEGWDGFSLGSLTPVLVMNDMELRPDSWREQGEGATSAAWEYTFGRQAVLSLRFRAKDFGVEMCAALRSMSSKDSVLNRVALLGTRPGAVIALGKRAEAIRIMEQGNYWGRVVPLLPPVSDEAHDKKTEPGAAKDIASRMSNLVSVVYDREAKNTFLAGFVTSERWLGAIELGVRPDGRVTSWRIGFDGGDLVLAPGQEITLEEVIFLGGPDPWQLLETYADVVRDRHRSHIPASPPVSWCSWYPYRLGVTEERILENARIAAERLKPLGLSIIEADLGWEKGHLPSSFEENERFPHGLKWLSEELRKLGFDLGVWKAPFTISEFDPLVREHPEWLIRDGTGHPVAYWTWFWAPHGDVFILDLTHPGAREWLKERMESLHDRGVRYFKADFIGCVSHELAKNRYDRSIVAGGGVEAARLGADIIRKALPEALLLNCGGPEMPGTGHWPLLYTCNDTGNTGFISWDFHRENYQTVACHLFKNRRWGILQPSCLCVGLPGTLEEARLRATAAFLSGGQIDISDTLTTLPEDRWEVLVATLPPLGVTAKPVDLFEPVYDQPSYEYVGTCKGEDKKPAPRTEHSPGSVWHVHVKADWDEWDLVGLFSFSQGSSSGSPAISRFIAPLSLLGLSPQEPRWGYEFWSRQFLGTVPAMRKNAPGYAHPGDFQDLTVGDAPDTLDIAFFGPAAKLLCLRPVRPHPWVLGATFHQSCGAELRSVTWDAKTSTLSGEVHRPIGETGFVVITDAGRTSAGWEVDGLPVTARRSANGSWLIPVIIRTPPAQWRVSFANS